MYNNQINIQVDKKLEEVSALRMGQTLDIASDMTSEFYRIRFSS